MTVLRDSAQRLISPHSYAKLRAQTLFKCTRTTFVFQPVPTGMSAYWRGGRLTLEQYLPGAAARLVNWIAATVVCWCECMFPEVSV